LLPSITGVLPGSLNPTEKVSQAEYSAAELFAQLGLSNSKPYALKKTSADTTIMNIFEFRMKFIIKKASLAV